MTNRAPVRILNIDKKTDVNFKKFCYQNRDVAQECARKVGCLISCYSHCHTLLLKLIAHPCFESDNKESYLVNIYLFIREVGQYIRKSLSGSLQVKRPFGVAQNLWARAIDGRNVQLARHRVFAERRVFDIAGEADGDVEDLLGLDFRAFHRKRERGRFGREAKIHDVVVRVSERNRRERAELHRKRAQRFRRLTFAEQRVPADVRVFFICFFFKIPRKSYLNSPRTFDTTVMVVLSAPMLVGSKAISISPLPFAEALTTLCTLNTELSSN